MTATGKKKILVVDDEITVCKSIRQAILSEDYEVDMALSGEEALGKDKEKNYDLIITDLMMPGMSGLDLLKQIKASRPEARVVMITGYPTIRTAVESIKMGAFDYIPKPFTPAELRALVSRAIKPPEAEAVSEAKVVETKIPAGYYYLLGHTWLKLEEGNQAKIGVMPDFLNSIGIITQLELPRIGDFISQGEVCAKITDADRFVHRVWSPATGRVIEINVNLLQDNSLLRRFPFEEGYLFKIEASRLEEDLQGLLLAK
jgi:CheY-like chemotaxis protein/glycine cleavage system H lipoate-binding protein